eukprot:TRINITY_DN3606_c0_g1_i1.p1 TRINITY_DN3606_c0_g1~~TRINITY_DN3606_c0_g1_i1.p1  ORF type:complete len:111 (+),score=25.55 TRINITY_DN3606_c0_g1_i1:41-373(+)
MNYRVAIDKNGTANELMRAYNVTGIPHAFVIDANGKIRYHGHPMEPTFANTLEKLNIELEETKKSKLKSFTADQLSAMSVKELKQILTDNGADYRDLTEKRELVERILRL